ncbi:TIR domain-containing protein [Rhizobium ruizarguesonis]|uniref:nSTAND1 domain-containing NTPase n=1 Tax=Rhizobium ruizarguesonis TaxID=2081791 RepID=UPI0010302A5F|nr:TIR domain-containing protein [Rhizobium ruizarguesonis]TAU59267.1 TIR domain-containing protein [Rhizobium ruizarguesonis]TAU59319.1 TIR domain-containing protein [Rhizobium ruizarguesonis]TAU60953.1 TIR domain-containing protein [Rhizobium ruizarguesonis]TAW47961.1 TIR domain-containing protein [Rhizobium ruizarguesonis]TAW80986.1 TIR domain-containing protein [Rhizobium ruizarguesonis]
MSRIFISHSSRNNAEALAIRDWLILNGWNDYFLDLDPERGIVAGQRWERALHDAANRCQAVLFLVSEAWLTSDWCEKEMMLAHKLDKPMFGVIIDDKVTTKGLPPKLKAYWQAVDLSKGRDGVIMPTLSDDRTDEQHVTFSESGLKRLKAGLDRAGLDASFFAWPPEEEPRRSPYRGLRPLDAVDAGIFFGRDGLIVEALDRLRGLREAAPPRLLVILGASGAGKSSFLRAGVIPRLDRDDRRFLVLPPIRAAFGAINGEAGLVQAFDTTAARISLKKDRATIRKAVETGGQVLADLVKGMCNKARPPASPDDPDIGLPTLVIPIDQGEELFPSDWLPETAILLTRLVELLHLRDAVDGTTTAGRSSSATTLVIITIRSDAYERLQTSPALSAIAHTPFSVGPMTEANFKDVVIGPADVLNKNTRRKLELKQDFIDTLLSDVIKDGGPDKMPLLAFVMERMFLDHGGDDVITLEEYRESGGIGGAIEKAMNDALVTLAGNPNIPTDRDAIHALLRRTLIPQLAVVDPTTREPQSRSALRGDLPSEGLPLIDALVEKRLLTSDTEPNGGQTRLQIAHEALLRQWQPMREWLRADGEAIAMLRRAGDTAREWGAKGRPDDWLQHSGTLLDLTIEQSARNELKSLVNDETAAYLAACRARDEARKAEGEAREAERRAAAARELEDAKRIAQEQSKAAVAATGQVAAEKQARRRTLAGAAIASALATVAIIGGLIAWYEQGQASQKATVAAINEELAVERETVALTALSGVAAQSGQYRDALMLALAAWPRTGERNRPTLRRTFVAFNAAAPKAREILRLWHREPVFFAAVSPDGKRVITTSADATARLWDAMTGAPIGKTMKHGDAVNSVAFSPDGTRVVTASRDNTARLWDATTGEPIGKPMSHGGTVNSAVFSPDGKRVVTASDDGTARLWDAATGAQIGDAMKHGSTVNSAVFSPDGTRIVTASRDGTARLWDAMTGAPFGDAMRHAGGHLDWVSSATFSPDGTRIVTVSDDTVRLWNAATGEPIGKPMSHGGTVNSAAFSPDGTRVVTASEDHTARLWDVMTGTPIGEPMSHEGTVYSAAFSPDGARIVTASEDHTARLWDVVTGTLIGEPMSHEGTVNSAVFSPDGKRVATASQDGTARLWDVMTGTPIGAVMKHEGKIHSAAFSPDGKRIVTASDDHTARLWDAMTGAPIGKTMKHGDAVNSVAFSPDGTRVVTASRDNTARLWDATTGEPIGKPMSHGGTVKSAVFSPDGKRVVTASDDGTARLWDAATGAQIGDAMKHGSTVNSAVFSPDGTRIVTVSDATVRLWNAATGAPIGEPIKDGGTVHSATFSPDGTRIVTVSDDTVRLWNAVTGAPIGQAMRHWLPATAVAFSPDGTRLVTNSSDGTARFWNAMSGAPIGELMVHRGEGTSTAFSPDGTRVVTASNDDTTRLWDGATGVLIGEAIWPKGRVDAASFSPDGKFVVVTAGTIARVFGVPSFGELHGFAIGCAMLGPQIDLAEIETKYGLEGLKPICGESAPKQFTVAKLK